MHVFLFLSEEYSEFNLTKGFMTTPCSPPSQGKNHQSVPSFQYLIYLDLDCDQGKEKKEKCHCLGH